MQEVVTSTAASIVSERDDGAGDRGGDVHPRLGELTLFALALLPLFVLMTKRVGDQRREVAKVRSPCWATARTAVSVARTSVGWWA